MDTCFGKADHPVPHRKDRFPDCGWGVENQTPSGGHSWFGRQVSAKPRTLDTSFQPRIFLKPHAVDISVSVGFWYNVFIPVGTERKNTMARKELNTEELAELRDNPYVASIIAGRISFTPEFKRKAYRLLMEGRTMRSIFEEHGIASEILGDKRIWAFAHKLRTNADRDEGFADLRRNNSRKPPSQTREQALAARGEQLEHELAYTRQEVEFLKKIHTADLEARKSWESRLRQK